MNIKELAGETRELLKTAALAASARVWRAPLSQPASFERLRRHLVYERPHPPVALPYQPAANCGDLAHAAETRTFVPDCVWELAVGQADIRSLGVCRAGGLIINGKWLPDLDFSATAGLLDLPLKPRRQHYPLVVAPWPHLWASFYDYVTFVVAKLCRIEQVYGPEIWLRAKVCYPLLHTGFERDFLRKLGIPAENLIDTAPLWNTALSADRVIVANSQPSWSSSAGDLALLRQRFRLPEMAAGAGRRIYLERRGRRRVLNEAPVYELLRAHDFEILEDRAYSIDEQIALFQQAGVVVAPHGAGLTNLLWCEPGTRVLEFFYNGYAPNYYHYLTTALQLDYHFLVDYSAGPAGNHWTNMSHDMLVDVPALERQLQRLLVGSPPPERASVALL
ncbi:glycosyltransferase family 61 protein [Hymenobacter sp. B81]|uniref:glycosyltransferase family 61 protein n=1 Tax=Hymenobacter sp. B81 TaxID=3344878 RepID=UPI0037DBF7D7